MCRLLSKLPRVAILIYLAMGPCELRDILGDCLQTFLLSTVWGPRIHVWILNGNSFTQCNWLLVTANERAQNGSVYLQIQWPVWMNDLSGWCLTLRINSSFRFPTSCSTLHTIGGQWKLHSLITQNEVSSTQVCCNGRTISKNAAGYPS